MSKQHTIVMDGQPLRCDDAGNLLCPCCGDPLDFQELVFGALDAMDTILSQFPQDHRYGMLAMLGGHQFGLIADASIRTPLLAKYLEQMIAMIDQQVERTVDKAAERSAVKKPDIAANLWPETTTRH